MSFLKDFGQFAGEITGKVLGGSVRVVGELTGSGFVKEVGNSVEKATIATGKTAGQLASGAFDITKGVITQDKRDINEGLSDIGEAVTTTARGAALSARYVYTSGKDVVTGIRDDDPDKAKQGAKNLAAAAAVSVLAIGILDAAGGPNGGVDMADADVELELPDEA
ncbi:hypothetical protein [Paenibacillus tepidiphilus]|uniref:hypothetical protein n=1 Tax=Paenibacillus tepidiphilus TaxID=2608683 RepID=UPI001239E7A8|nr:hypothetical protein [Paenibacillus tepidiphilus]